MEDDLYNILNINNNATYDEIKKNFKILALKYHPDKNLNSNTNEKFNQIRVAYEILSDKVKRKQYDEMGLSKKKNFVNTILLFLKELTNPKSIQNLLKRIDLVHDIKAGNLMNVAEKIIKRILKEIDTDIDIEKLNQIFISNTNTNTNNSSSDKPVSSDLNTLNITGTLVVPLIDIYNNKLKEIIIKRKIYDLNNNITNYESSKYYIPLYDHKVIIQNEGDIQIIEKNLMNQGSIILKVNEKKDTTNKYKRDNYNIIYNDKITLYELFYGYNKILNYFNTDLNIVSEQPLKEWKFDGDKLTIIINNMGLPKSVNSEDTTRGNLIINLFLDKSGNFEDKIRSIYI
jgi:DnaJ-class molecular chaperone